MRYFVIGYPGCGKTTICKQWSEESNILLLDSDEQISKANKLTISEIFDLYGEQYFRDLEYKFIRDLNDTDMIVSCGGGLPCYKDNMEYMLDNGVVIWIKVSLDIIEERIKKDGLEKRPLMFKLAKTGQLSEYIKLQYNEREKIYKKANIILDYEKFSDYKWSEFEFVREKRT